MNSKIASPVREVWRIVLLSLVPGLPVAGVLIFLACLVKPQWQAETIAVGVAMFLVVLYIEYKMLSLPDERSITKRLMG